MLKEFADSYHARFGRPLPVTSLVRPDEYQRRLSATNANATRIDTPPHSTGLAFDILYRHMTAEEQAHVMAHIARLRDAGRVEALRENRDHFHVFAFIDGKRPAKNSSRLARRAVAPKAGRRSRPQALRKSRACPKKEGEREGRKKEVEKRRPSAGEAEVEFVCLRWWLPFQ